jgi:hypothetical protein
LRFPAHIDRARKVAFYAPVPYKKLPVGTTNLDTSIFGRRRPRYEPGEYARRGL